MLSFPDTAAVGFRTPEQVILGYGDLVPAAASAFPIAHRITGRNPGYCREQPERFAFDAVTDHTSAASCVSADQVPFLLYDLISALAAAQPCMLWTDAFVKISR